MSTKVTSIDKALKTLGLTPASLTSTTLKTSYLKLAKRYHPDLIPPSQKETEISQER